MVEEVVDVDEGLFVVVVVTPGFLNIDAKPPVILGRTAGVGCCCCCCGGGGGRNDGSLVGFVVVVVDVDDDKPLLFDIFPFESVKSIVTLVCNVDGIDATAMGINGATWHGPLIPMML